MNQRIDPRTLGFSYSSSWEGKKPKAFYIAERVADYLGRKATELGKDAWDLEMALKDVRIACGAEERRDAMADLEKELSKHIPDWNEA